MTLTVWLPAGMVTEFVPAVDSSSSVPVQPAIFQPESGKAPLRLMISPATYSPAGQPVEFAGLPAGSLPIPVWSSANVKQAAASSTKIAVTVLLPLSVIESGLVLPVRSPDQLSKCQPVSALAVNCTTSPYS